MHRYRSILSRPLLWAATTVARTQPAEDSYVVFFNGTDLPDLIFDRETTRELYITPRVDHLPWPTTEGRFELACGCLPKGCFRSFTSYSWPNTITGEKSWSTQTRTYMPEPCTRRLFRTCTLAKKDIPWDC